MSNQDSFSAMSASRTIQAASIFYLDNLLATASALYTSSACCSGKFFYIDIFSTHYFLYLSCSIPSSWLWGKPCTVSSTFRSPSLLEPVQIQPSLTGSPCVSFRSHYSPRTFFWIFHISPQDEDKGGRLPHQALFFC